MLKDQRDLLRALNAHHAEYLVVGGHASIAYGVARLTGDMDVWIRMSEENSLRVFKALADFGAPLQGLSSADFNTTETDYFQFGIIPARIDVLQGIDGVSFESAWQRRIYRTIEDGLDAPYLSLEDLLSNKSAVGRPKDLADIAELRKAKKLNS
ncbi:DUF6036 family nucleotidyltransferase [Granulicella cerasi]|uniref:DUF6036 family nucleotidyltransferase n=1 Tax=Granulicella cerasi TaxID=741063 RepID=A0ABW1ZD27_9BACT|nr:DUF6036 family nucleotidyltransferase [Granulicella cerasi]